MLCLAITFFAFIGVIAAASVPFISCGVLNTVRKITIKPCQPKIVEGNKMCFLPQDTEVLVEATFKAPFSESRLQTLATAVVEGEEFPFPESGHNPCPHNITPKCPVVKGNRYKFRSSFKVWKYYPTGEISVKFGVVNTRGDYLGCAIVTVNIVKSSSS